MNHEVWGNVKEWGLVDHSDGSVEMSTDPVCGMQVVENQAAGKTSYAGIDYYFCSKECQKEFDEAPGDYFGQPHGPSSRMVDINAATAEDLRDAFHVDNEGLNQILENRPYHSWTEFQSKNPGFSDPMLKGLRRSGVFISTPDLNRLV